MDYVTTETPAAVTTDEKITLIRDWLRFHGDYDVTIDLWASYGCYRVEITRLGQHVDSNLGETLGRRLDWVIRTLGIATDAEVTS